MSNIDKQDRQVSRYDLVSGYMQKWPDGEFVYHSDYQALLDELEAKDKQIGDLKATAAHSNAGWKEAHEQEARAEAAEKRIAELERKEQHSERQSVIDALAGSGEEWSDIEEYMQKWDAARAAMLQGAEPVTTAYKLRDAVEIIRNSGIEIDSGKIQAERDSLNSPVIPDCSCRTCRQVTFSDSRFVVCPECGNKRCPHANDHRNACTGSNEPGQEGSSYPAAPQQEVK